MSAQRREGTRRRAKDRTAITATVILTRVTPGETATPHLVPPRSAAHPADPTSGKRGPCSRTLGQGKHQRERVKIGEPLGGKPVLAQDEAIDRLPSDGSSACRAANGELDQDAVDGGTPAMNLGGHVGHQLEQVGEGTLASLQTRRGRRQRREETSVHRQNRVEALGRGRPPELGETSYEIRRSLTHCLHLSRVPPVDSMPAGDGPKGRHGARLDADGSPTEADLRAIRTGSERSPNVLGRKPRDCGAFACQTGRLGECKTPNGGTVASQPRDKRERRRMASQAQ